MNIKTDQRSRKSEKNKNPGFLVPGLSSRSNCCKPYFQIDRFAINNKINQIITNPSGNEQISQGSY